MQLNSYSCVENNIRWPTTRINMQEKKTNYQHIINLDRKGTLWLVSTLGNVYSLTIQ